MNFKEALKYLDTDRNNKLKDEAGYIYSTYSWIMQIDEDYPTVGDILRMLDQEFEVVK
jgi:hypothetical protein